MGYNASGSKTRKTARPKVLPAISYSRNGHTQKYAFAPAYCRKSQTAADRNRNIRGKGRWNVSRRRSRTDK